MNCGVLRAFAACSNAYPLTEEHRLAPRAAHERDVHRQAVAAQFDVAIVGSGFGGAVCAYRLAKAGARVLVLERRTSGARRWNACAGQRAETPPRAWVHPGQCGVGQFPGPLGVRATRAAGRASATSSAATSPLAIAATMY